MLFESPDKIMEVTNNKSVNHINTLSPLITFQWLMNFSAAFQAAHFKFRKRSTFLEKYLQLSPKNIILIVK